MTVATSPWETTRNGRSVGLPLVVIVPLQDATDLDTVRSDLAATVHQALEPEHLTLWSGRPKL